MKTTFKSILARATVVLLSGVMLLSGCKKPNEGLTYYISSAVFKYTASVKFQDPANGNAAPAGLTLTLKGTDAASVYDFSGFKGLKLNAGQVTMGLDPSFVPTTGKSYTVTVLAEAPGYRDENVTITFSATGDQTIPLRKINMLNLAKPSEGVAVATTTTPVTAGVVAAPIVVNTPTSSTATQTATVTIPTGTQLRDGAGAVVPTGSASLSVVNLDVEKPSSIQFIPGNDLIQTVLVAGVPTPTIFTPGALTTVEMFAANGTEIKNFSQPITVRVNLDPTSTNPATKSPIKVGDAVKFYSYDAAKDAWTFESAGVIQSAAGVLFTNLSVTHLTTFLTSFDGAALCANLNTVITVTGTNNGYMPPAGSTDVYTFRAFYLDLNGNKKLTNFGSILLSVDNKTITLDRTPIGAYTLEIYDVNSNTVGSVNLTNCAQTGIIPVNFTAPTVDNPMMTIDITAVCPTAGTAIAAPLSTKAPSGTIIQYKESGVGAFTDLGTVNNLGQVITNKLFKSKSYDFQVFIAQAGTNFPNGITKGWTGVTLTATGVTTGQNGTGANQGTITSQSVAFAPDNKSGTIGITYTVNSGWCK